MKKPATQMSQETLVPPGPDLKTLVGHGQTVRASMMCSMLTTLLYAH